MLVLKPRGGAKANQNAGESGDEGGSSFVVRPVYHAGYGTREMSLAFACELWYRCLANDVDYFVLPALEGQNNVIYPRQDAESAVSGCAPGAVDVAIELELTPTQGDE